MDLKTFLEAEGLDTVYETLTKKNIKTLKALRNLWANPDSKVALVAAFSAENPDPIWKGEADAFTALTLDTIDKALAAEVKRPIAEPTLPEADLELKTYLKKKGFDDQAISLVEHHGATSLASFQALCEDASLKKKLHAELSEGVTHGDKRFLANPLKAQLLQQIDIGEIRAKLNELNGPTEDTSVLNAKNDPRRKALTLAIQEVEAARKAVVTEASKDMAGVQKRVTENLKEVLTKADSGKILDQLKQGTFADLKSLDTALAAARDAINLEIEKQILIAQRDVKELSLSALGARLCVFRGFHMDASRVVESTASDLLSMTTTLQAPGPYDDDCVDFSSQSSYDFAESTVEKSSSSFATVNQASGAAFVGSGIGALSVAGSYAQSKEQYKAQANALRTNTSCRIRVRKIRQPQGVLTLPRDMMTLSAAASTAIHGICNAANADAREKLALMFLRKFGSHVFESVVVGGCFKVVATAYASSREEVSKVDSALGHAFQWGASMSASYLGLGGMGTVSSGNTGEGDSSQGHSTTQHQTQLKQEIKLKTVVSGGVQNLSLELWKSSLQKNPFWVVLDRNDALAIWEILDDPGVKEIPTASLELAQKALEKVWVQKIFVPSLKRINAQLADRPSVRQAESCEALESAIRSETTPPPMSVVVFRRDYGGKIADHLQDKWELDAGYKILSGGVAGVGGNLLVSSYPSLDSNTGRWSWNGQMKNVAETANCTHEMTLIALHDPDNEWDVEIFRLDSTSPEIKQVVMVDVGEGYVLTGGGAQVDRFSSSVLTGCGPYLDVQAPIENPAFAPGFRASSRGIAEELHRLTAYAIGIKPRNQALLKPRYQVKEYKSTTAGAYHYEHTMRREAGSGICVGGGAFLLDPKRTGALIDDLPANYLTASRPAFDTPGKKSIGWSAASKDQGGIRGAADTIMVTIGLAEMG